MKLKSILLLSAIPIPIGLLLAGCGQKNSGDPANLASTNLISDTMDGNPNVAATNLLSGVNTNPPAGTNQ
ncbi:MAG: hypothetical protein P4N60_23875 [Verrucomicrobiae bacterium]|nr:hypothetical protein [Verrucomicrobiae bacterium]